MPTGKAQRGGTLGINQSKAPSFTADDIRAQLRRYDRGPFMDLLAAWLECAPTPEDIIELAAKKPELWVSALGGLAKMAGFTEKSEVAHTHVIGRMSDHELAERARELSQRLGIPMLELEAVHETDPEKSR